jgi:hypothetical protein
MNRLTQYFFSKFIPVFLLITSFNLSAQSNWEAGVRFGDNFSIDATIPIGATPRLHPAVYFDRFGVATYFDWMFALSDGPTGLKFYPGVGPEFFFEDRFDFAVAGNFGVEYAFKFPMTIGFDWRPGFRLTNGSKWKSDNWGIIVRYRFNKGAKLVPAN